MTTTIKAVSVVVLRDGAVLMVRRGRPPSQGLYAFPGGRVEAGETLEQAARRELAEETGLSAGGLEPFRELTLEAGDDGGAPQFALHVFVAREMQGEPVAGDDAEAAGFFGLDALGGLPVTESTLAIARELLEQPSSAG